MSIPNYRVVLSFDADRKVYVARAPELEHCAAEGATRGEAILHLEQEIEAQVRNMQERGQRPPPPIDETTFSGELMAKVSRTLHRDLHWQARVEGIELDQFCSELLGQGLEARRQQGRPGRGNRAEHQAHAQDNAGNQREPERERPRQGYGSRYHGIMDDRANFIEYVRGLEADARGNARGPRGDRGGSGGGGGGGGGDRGDNRGPRRRRGRGGPPGPQGGPGGGPQRGPGPSTPGTAQAQSTGGDKPDSDKLPE